MKIKLIFGLLIFAGILNAAYFDATNVWLETSTSGTVSKRTRDFRMFIPDNTNQIKGAIFFWPGDDDDVRWRVTQKKFQDTAASLDFALIGIGKVGNNFTVTFPAEAEKCLSNFLKIAAQVSGRLELTEVPHMHTGFSRGAWNCLNAGQAASEQVISYAPSRGAGIPFTGYSAIVPKTVQKIPAIFLPGSEDFKATGTHSSLIKNTFQILRSNDYPVAFGVDRRADHNSDVGQSWEIGFYYMTEVYRKRVNTAGGYPEPVNGKITLPNLSLENGWLGQSEEFNTSTANNTSLKSYPFPYIASYNSYTGEVVNASWMPSEGAAIAYRAFAANYGTVYESINGGFRNGPVYITNLGAFALANNNSNLTVNVNSRTFNAIQMELYLDDVVIAQDTDGANGWAFSTVLSNAWRGVHALTVVATDADGGQTSCFRTIVVQNEP